MLQSQVQLKLLPLSKSSSFYCSLVLLELGQEFDRMPGVLSQALELVESVVLQSVTVEAEAEAVFVLVVVVG
jgi:hypothetical protein